MTRLLVLGGAALAATLAAPGAAHAGRQVVTFDNLPAGTLVSDQYRHAPLAANQGVLFGFSLSEEDDRYSPIVDDVGGALARSGTKVARACLDKPSCGLPGAGARFLVEQTQPVTIHAGGIDTGGGQAVLFGVTLGGRIVDQAFATIPSGSSAPVPLTVTPPPNDPIVAVQFGLLCCANPAGRIVFDDLTFTTPDPLTPPPPPRFALRLSGPSELSLRRPQAATTTLALDRVNGSRGAMNYHVDGLPDGVTATFAPAATTDAARVVLTLTAAADGPVADYPVSVRATPVDPAASGAGAPDRLGLTLSIRARPDPRVRAIELTQGTQTDHDEVVLPGFSDRSIDYKGVPLVAHMKTIARVYADALGVFRTYVNASVGLFGFRDGKQLPGSPLLPQFGADRLPTFTPDATLRALRRSAGRPPAGPYTFTLPDAWTQQGGLTLEARVVPPQGIVLGQQDAYCDTASCRTNDTFVLKGITFIQRPEQMITPLALYTCQPDRPCGFDGAQGFPPKPKDVFAQALAAFPNPLRVTSYGGGFEVTDIRPAEIAELVRKLLELSRSLTGEPKEISDDLVAKEARKATMAELDGRLKDYIARNPFVASGFSTVGVQTGVDAGFAPKSSPRRALVDHKRPLTSVAHELGHNLGAPHASSACGAVGDQAGEAWPPDKQGRLQGIGLDRRPASGGPNGEYRIIAEQETPNIRVYDFMSYCASDDRSWISPRNWRRFVGAVPKATNKDKDPPEPPIWKQPIQVSGYASAASIAITDVTRAPSLNDPPAGGSGFRLVARDASGRIVSQVPMTADAPYVHGDQMTFLHGEIPAATVERAQRSAGGIASLAVASGTRASVPLLRSPQRPKVRLLTPRRSDRVGRRQTTVVRWRASDADGDPMTASLDYSADDGRRWRSVFAGPNRNRATLQSRLLSRSRRARLRLRVNDGFNETVVMSKRFRALGGRPSVAITSPGRGNRLRQDAAAYLRGYAFDDALRPLRGRRLTWFVGRNRIGHGERLSVTGLPAGRRRIRLTARDGSGRRTTASVAVRITAVKPLFLVLKGPERLGRRARKVRLRVAASIPATLLVRGQRFGVNRRARSVIVEVPASRRKLTLRLQLRSGRRNNRATLRIARR
ncbi:MAG: hypothetical protein M3N47_06495 [Chloroflexota bacterium]|nr:hypothetical protein [Chloroflexota bacterium]